MGNKQQPGMHSKGESGTETLKGRSQTVRSQEQPARAHKDDGKKSQPTN